MKNLNYILFSIFLSFVCMNNVEAATCVYETSYTAPYEYTITCVSNGSGNVTCTVQDSYSQLSIANGAENFTISGDTCPNTIYTASANNVISSINTSSGDALSLNKNKSINGNTSSTTAKYENDDVYIAAKKEAEKYCNSQDFVNQDDAKCEEAKKKMEAVIEYYKKQMGNSGGNSVNQPVAADDYINDDEYIAAKKDAEKYCNSQDFVNQDDAKCKEAKKKMEAVIEYYKNQSVSADFNKYEFCKGPVQGVFTTLGWVFFILKILIPLLLIIFGSIDVAKAVIASKDDEIKKSAQTLGFRAAAGIIIFLVPTFLNFIVKLIDNSEVYRGTFWDCTKCMLEPNNDVCSTLRGDN